MEYASYQNQQHAQAAPHMQAYAHPTHSGAAGASITSPTQQAQMHSGHNQVSPVLNSQSHFGQAQPSMGYPQAYPVHAMHPQYMAQTQAAAAAMATAAAAGYSNYSSIPGALAQDPSASPRLPSQQVKPESRQAPRSPPQAHMNPPASLAAQMGMPPAQSMPQSLPQRRMSSVSSPMQNPQAAMAMGRPSVPPQVAAQQAAAPAQQSSPEATGATEESPLYVNAKQFHRILKRRMARQRLEEQLRLTSKGRKPYLHESRHNHAMRRPRGPGGRFLTADEVAAMEANGELPTDDHDSASVSKRKASDARAANGKRAKTEHHNGNGGSGEDDEGDEGDY